MATTRPVSIRIAFAVADACAARIGQRPEIIGPPEADERTLTFAADLTAQQQATVDLILSAAAATVAITPEEYDAIRPNLQALRDLRQLGRNAFMSSQLNDAERFRRLYDAQADTTVILLALLRSS